MAKGLSIRANSLGIPILRLHYTAHPDRTEEWVREMRGDPEHPKISEAMWLQEQEIDYSAAGGERVLRELLVRRWKEIVITDPKWTPDPGWRYSNGLDYGKSHPTALIACAMDFEGRRYALAEHYRSGLTPAQHMPMIKTMRLPCLENGMNPLLLQKAAATVCDPSMGFENVAQDDRFTSYVELFIKAGFPRIQIGIRGLDLRVVDEIIDAWNQPDPMFKIVCRVDFPIDPGSLKKREGTYERGCPNLLWELMNLRRKEHSAARVEAVGEAEGLVDRDNDGWDALKYWWTASTAVPEVASEILWRKEWDRLKKSNPNIDLNTLIYARAQWDKKQQQSGSLSWR